MKEAYIEGKIVKLIRGYGGEAFLIIGRGRKGLPDVVCLLRGVTFFLEVKRPGETTTAHQDDIHDRIHRQDGHVFVVDCIEDVQAALAELFGGEYDLLGS